MSLGTDDRARGPSSVGALRPALPIWELLGRFLLLLIGQILVVPSPWTGTSFYRLLSEHTALPDGKRLKFAGQAGDIWYVFVGMALVVWLRPIIQHAELPQYLGYLGMPLSWVLAVLLMKWFCANVRSEDGQLKLSFDGGYWAYVGWNVLLIVSLMTIVGWAWVLKFMMQWVCRNVRGSASFDFTATGWEILWRTFAFGFACIFIIPIPWMIRWYKTWFISQISVGPPGWGAITSFSATCVPRSS